MKPRINREKLVMQSVMGEIHHPTMRASAYRLEDNGVPYVLPGTGAITYNVKIGDSVYGFAADHVEPGVSIKNSDVAENAALNTLACVGNTAYVVSGDAKGEKGYVTGTHGGIEHVLVYFEESTLDKLCIKDKIQIRAQGLGMVIEGFEDTVKAMNMDPRLFDAMNIEVRDGKLYVPVAGRVPAYLMGSGIGSSSAYSGDYDIMTADWDVIVRYGLDKLRFGDLVLLENCDTSYGRGYLTGAATIGVVVHSDCILAGHGPGVTTLLTSRTGALEGVIDDNANIGNYMRGE
ncbi:MAG: DUF4438 domain-containing protein [Clostridia bacterium]|nr:DUF4438 domain-containing protein [Clostridia bacterium]